MSQFLLVVPAALLAIAAVAALWASRRTTRGHRLEEELVMSAELEPIVRLTPDAARGPVPQRPLVGARAA